MAFGTSASALLESVRRRAYLPSTGGFSDADLLGVMNEEMLSYLAPFMVTIGEEFFVADEDFTTTDGVASYAIPYDSLASKVRDVQVLSDTDGTYRSLAHTEPERAAGYGTGTGLPVAYYLSGTSIVLLPEPSPSTSIRLRYYRRPSQMALTGYAATESIVSAGGGNLVVGVASTAGFANGSFDLLDPQTYDPILANATGVVTDDTTITLSGLTSAQVSEVLAAALAGGLIIATAGTAPGAQIPPEAAILLATRCAALVLQQQSDARQTIAFAECERVKQTLRDLFAPRAAGRPRRVVNPHGPGWGRRWGFRGGWEN